MPRQHPLHSSPSRRGHRSPQKKTPKGGGEAGSQNLSAADRHFCPSSQHSPRNLQAQRRWHVGILMCIAISRMRHSTREPLSKMETNKLMKHYYNFANNKTLAIKKFLAEQYSSSSSALTSSSPQFQAHSTPLSNQSPYIDSLSMVRDLVFSSGELMVESELSDCLQRVNYLPGDVFSLGQYLQLMEIRKRKCIRNLAFTDTEGTFSSLLGPDEKDIAVEDLLSICEEFQLSKDVLRMVIDADQDHSERIDFWEFREFLEKHLATSTHQQQKPPPPPTVLSNEASVSSMPNFSLTVSNFEQQQIGGILNSGVLDVLRSHENSDDEEAEEDYAGESFEDDQDDEVCAGTISSISPEYLSQLRQVVSLSRPKSMRKKKAQLNKDQQRSLNATPTPTGMGQGKHSNNPALLSEKKRAQRYQLILEELNALGIATESQSDEGIQKTETMTSSFFNPLYDHVKPQYLERTSSTNVSAKVPSSFGRSFSSSASRFEPRAPFVPLSSPRGKASILPLPPHRKDQPMSARYAKTCTWEAYEARMDRQLNNCHKNDKQRQLSTTGQKQFSSSHRPTSAISNSSSCSKKSRDTSFIDSVRRRRLGIQLACTRDASDAFHSTERFLKEYGPTPPPTPLSSSASTKGRKIKQKGNDGKTETIQSSSPGENKDKEERRGLEDGRCCIPQHLQRATKVYRDGDHYVKLIAEQMAAKVKQ